MRGKPMITTGLSIFCAAISGRVFRSSTYCSRLTACPRMRSRAITRPSGFRRPSRSRATRRIGRGPLGTGRRRDPSGPRRGCWLRRGVHRERGRCLRRSSVSSPGGEVRGEGIADRLATATCSRPSGRGDWARRVLPSRLGRRSRPPSERNADGMARPARRPGSARARRDLPLQWPGLEAESLRERLLGNRCPAEEALRPDPERGRDRKGLRLARERDPRGGHGRAGQGARAWADDGPAGRGRTTRSARPSVA